MTTSAHDREAKPALGTDTSTPKAAPIVVVEDGTSLEHYTFAAILRRMYARYRAQHPGADLSGEVGIHRLVFRSPFDPEGRRQTTFARVGDGSAFVRHYILHPYTLAKNGKTDSREVEDVYAVLSGDRLGELLYAPIVSEGDGAAT